MYSLDFRLFEIRFTHDCVVSNFLFTKIGIYINLAIKNTLLLPHNFN